MFAFSAELTATVPSINIVARATSALPQKYRVTVARRVSDISPGFHVLPLDVCSCTKSVCSCTFRPVSPVRHRAGQTTETDYKRLMKEMELYGTAFQGLKIRSRCLDYVMPQEHCSAHVKDTLSTLVVEQKNEDGKTRPVYRAAPGKLSQVFKRNDNQSQPATPLVSQICL